MHTDKIIFTIDRIKIEKVKYSFHHFFLNLFLWILLNNNDVLMQLILLLNHKSKKLKSYD